MHDAALGTLADALAAQAKRGELPAVHRLRQAFEGLVLTNPQAAVQALEAHAEVIAGAGADLGNLLVRALLERKLLGEAVRLLRLARGSKLVSDAAVCVRADVKTA